MTGFVVMAGHRGDLFASPGILAGDELLEESLISRQIGEVPSATQFGVTCAVSDTGIGMSAQEIAVALVPFAQVEDDLAKSYQGTGLGLPLAKRLIELPGGTLTVESVKHTGTTVRLTLSAERVLRFEAASVQKVQAARDCKDSFIPRKNANKGQSG